MLSFYLIFILFYLILLWGISRFWSPKEEVKSIIGKGEISVSLIISLRNEIENIDALIDGIRRIRYLNLEIILVDDHSEDGTWQVMQDRFSEGKNVKIFSNPGKGKKAAIAFAISVASGEIILTTDADCIWEEEWVSKMAAEFLDASTILVAGPVLSISGKGVLSGFQQVEWASILLVTNFSFRIHNPLTCSAANMAFRKVAYEEVEGFAGNEGNPSGDDEFLLKKIVARFGADSARYVISQKNLVLTKPEKNWNQLIQQKIRWASKWKSHASVFHSMSALFPLFLQLLWVISFGLLFLGDKGILLFFLSWSFKILAEWVAFRRILRTFVVSVPFPIFVVTSFVHPFYVVYIAMGVLRGKYIWKGRATNFMN